MEGFMELNNNLEIIGQKFNENAIEGIIIEKLGTKLNKDIPKDAFAKSKNDYTNGLVDQVIVWSDKYNQFLKIAKEEKNA